MWLVMVGRFTFEQLPLLDAAVSSTHALHFQQTTLLRSRQAERETGAPAGWRFQPHLSAMVDHDLTCLGKPQTPTIRFTGCDESLEQAVAYLWRNSRSSVENSDHDRIVPGHHRDMDRSAARHGLKGVRQQIRQNGTDPVAVHRNGQIRGNIEHHIHRLRFSSGRDPVYSAGNQAAKSGRVKPTLPSPAQIDVILEQLLDPNRSVVHVAREAPDASSYDIA